MTHEEPVERKPTRQQCIEAGAEIYGSILADPERRAAIIAHRANQTERADGEPLVAT